MDGEERMKQKMGKFIEDTDDIGKLEKILATLLELRGKLEAGQKGRNSPDNQSTEPIRPRHDSERRNSSANHPIEGPGRPQAEPGPDLFQEIRRARSQWKVL